MNEKDLKESTAEVEMEGQENERKFLTFHLAGEEYGIDISYVTEIIGIQKITAVPDMPPFVKGVINLRGNVYPVIDVRLRFNLPEREYDDRTCIIVVKLQGISVGLIVDTVSEVIDLPVSSIERQIGIREGAGSRFVEGMGKIDERVVILLSLNKLLYDEEIEAIEKNVN